MSIEMDNRIHAVTWTDMSQNIPNVLLSIVKEIEIYLRQDEAKTEILRKLSAIFLR